MVVIVDKLISLLLMRVFYFVIKLVACTSCHKIRAVMQVFMSVLLCLYGGDCVLCSRFQQMEAVGRRSKRLSVFCSYWQESSF